MVTRTWFTALVMAVAVQRLLELAHSRRNERQLIDRGAREHASSQMVIMSALHALWLVATVVEVWVLRPPFRLWLAVLALGVFAVGQVLRLLAMRALGPRWTVSVMTVPAAEPVIGGIYRYIRHPNYLGVILEIAALPLVHGAIWASASCSVANAVLLSARIRAEEQALTRDNGYERHFGARGRFLPTVRGPRIPS